MRDEFWEPARKAIYEIKIKRSLFISHAALTKNEEEAKEFILKTSQKHKQATHNCWAYRLGVEPVREYYSDDGEPSGTAGKPILGAILHSGLTNVTLVVTRYFGGIKLGVRGLIEAYGEAASLCLEGAGRKKAYLEKNCTIVVPYSFYSSLLYQLKNMGLREETFIPSFKEVVTFNCCVPLSMEKALESYLCDLQGQSLIEEWKWEDN